ncbi:hypothetical protein [Roseinatronobacter alkalisoli]|uniref:Uncharacterized protein n=1 Tax=Roseinatronobacter alkalisoli TaxID=3028235 RepID=A0ABT5TAZ1_9RHOB|nr:hypothetical protein [Roseinatronobacter sp. HJB301]MDD7971357.1 hypothetical protein [Roseinatronobacter sp. HJB301]
MRWLALSLAGPTLWAVMFTLLYAVHGTVCAGSPGPESLTLRAHMLLVALWGGGLLAHGLLFRALPAGGQGVSRYLPRAGAWIGLVATAFTLFPVLMITSC